MTNCSTEKQPGDGKEVRSARFYNMDDVEAKKAALETVIRSWIVLQDG